MADATIYCDQCGRAIQPDEMAGGEAIITPRAALCGACTGSLTTKQQVALLKGSAGRPVRKKRLTPAPAPEVPLSAAPPGPPAAGRAKGVVAPGGPVDFPEFEPEPEKPRTGRYVAVAVVALVLVGAVVFLLARGKGDEEETPSAVAPEPAAEKDTREAQLERIRALIDGTYSKYAEIRKELDAFLASHPGDEEAQAIRSEVEEGHGKLAEEALKAATDLARRLADSGFKEQAVAKVRSIAERYGESAWYRDRGEEAVKKLLGELGAVGETAAAEEAKAQAGKTPRRRRTTASRNNIVTNSAFEILDAKGMPVDWSLPPGVVLLEEGGDHFVRVEQAASTTACTFFTGKFELDRKWKTIHVSCRMRARNLRTGGRMTDKAMCLISFQGKKGRRLAAVPSGSPRLAKSSDWVQLDGEADVPRGAAYVVLKAGLFRSLGSLDVDDVTVGPERAERLAVRVSAPEVRAKTAWDRPAAGPGAREKPSGEADIRRAREAFGRGDFAGARRALEARGKWCESDLARAEQLLAVIEEAEAAAAERARLRDDAYTKLLLGLREAVREGIPKARARFRRESAALAAEHAERVGHLSKRIGEAELVAAVVAEGLAALRRPVRLDVADGKAISGRVQAVEEGMIRIKPLVGDPKEVRLVEVPPERLVEVTKILRRGAVTKLQLASFAFVLGDMDAAAKWVAEAKGGGAGALQDDIERMKTVLATAVPALPADQGKADRKAEARPAGPPAELIARMNAYLAQLPGGDFSQLAEGLRLTSGAVMNLARRYDKSKVTAKKLAAVGGAVAGSSGFDSSLKKRLPRDKGYVFTSRSGVAGRGKTIDGVLESVGRFLDREKPEFVRVCFDATDLAKGRTAEELTPGLTRIVSEILDRGAMPVLFTLAVPPPGEKEAYEKIASYNDMATDLADGLQVPCIDAWIVLNSNPGLKEEFFHPAGIPTRKGYDAVNSTVFCLYRVLENLVAGRDVPMPRAVAGKAEGRPGTPGAGEEEEPPPAGNLVTNGSFEYVAEGMPTGWQKHNWGAGGGAPVRSDRVESCKGGRSLQIRSAGRGSKVGAFTRVTMPKGRYEVRFYATADVDQAVNVCVRHGETELPAFVVSGDWKLYSKRFSVLRKETNVSFGFCVSSPSGRVWIDEVELKYVGR